MENLSNNEIIKKVDEIINIIKSSNEYNEYVYLENKLAKNIKANQLINEIKLTQKQLVKLEVNNQDTKDKENKLNNLLEELYKIPLYIEYVDKKQQLNDIYQDIKNTLDNYFYDKLN